MRSRKQEVIFMGVGILAGLALSGPAAQAATSITATLSNQPIYVDNQLVSMTAYSIGGNNYVRLRDIGQAVNFGVTYEAATNSVHIDSTQPYQEEVVQPTVPALGVTEENIQTALAKLKELYPSGTVYPNPYISSSKGPYSVSTTYCAGWAVLCSDAAFGDLPWRRIERPSWDQIRPGDLVEYRNSESYHVVVVVSKTDNYIRVTESGKSNKALWGGQYFQWWLEEQPHYISYTRYPQ